MNVSQKKYFDILGLPSGATQDEIKKSFKRLVFQYHPDRNPHNQWAEEKFKETVEAYSYLSGNLEAYHALRTPSKKTRSATEQAEDILKILFDIEPSPRARRPGPVKVELALTLEEAFQGGEKKILLDRQDLCADCQGRGVEEGAKVFTCTYCFGEGGVSNERDETVKECPKCNGRGFLSSRGCVHCRAHGVVEKHVKLKVQVPPKVRQGQVLTLPREGHEFNFGEREDLHVAIQLIKHPRFSFDGKDIICETSVEISEAALGGSITVPTLIGSKKLHIPPGTQSGQVFRMKGMGLGGDQFIRIWVKTPKVVSERERKIFRHLKEGEKGSASTLWSRFKKWIW